MIEKKNVATIYLLPGLIDNLKSSTKDLERMGLVNAYLTDVNHDKKWQDSIYLLFKVTDPVQLGDFILKHEDKIVDEYDYEGGFTVIVFCFPIKHIANYMAFKQGKYSWFTAEYKDLFNRLPSPEEKLIGLKKSVTHCVFNKSPDLRAIIEERIGEKLPHDSELASYPGEEVELRIEKLTIKSSTDA